MKTFIKLSAIFLLALVFEFSNVAPFFFIPEAHGIITPVQIRQGATTTGAATQIVAAFQPSANRLYLMWTIQSIGTSPPTTPTVSCANGLTFVQVNTRTFGTDATPLKRITLFRAMKSSGLTNNTCTISWGQTTNGHGHVIVEYNGVNTAGIDGAGAVVQNVVGSTNSAAAAVGLSLTLAALQPGSMSTGGFANNINNANSLSAGSGYTPGTGVNYGTPPTSLRAEWRTAGSITVNMTQSGTSHIGGIAVEVRAPLPITGNIVSSTFDTLASNGVTYNSILWRGARPLGTTVRLQLATSINPAGPFNFIGGTTCTGSDYYEPASDQAINIKCFSSFNNQRYFRYQVILCSSSDCTSPGSETPQIDDVMVNWSP